MIETVSNIIPVIRMSFNKNMLLAPGPIEDSRDLEKVFRYAIYLRGKLRPNQIDKYNKLVNEFEELYERSKDKEKELKEKNQESELFFYRMSSGPYNSDKKLYGKINYTAHIHQDAYE